MTRKEQVEVLNNKIKANKRQYDLGRINAEISAYSNGDLPKHEYLTKQDLGYKPNAFEQVKFGYSPLGKVYTDGLKKEDKSKKIGFFKRLKNIEDNLAEVDNNDNKVGIFQIIKDIKDKGIKIDNDDETIREIRERIKELIDDGVKLNNFDETKKEIMEHIQNLEKQGINVETNIDQINNLIDKIFNKKDAVEGKASNDIKIFLDKYKKTISTTYNKNKISTETINKELIKYYNGKISLNQFTEKYNEHKYDIKNFKDAMDKKKVLLAPTKKIFQIIIKN